MSERIKLLIIDDSPEDRLTYKRLLSSAETVAYDFMECDSGEEGLAFFGNKEADCVLLDYNLPDMDGIEVLELLAGKDGFHIPVIFLTGQGNETIAVKAMKSGASDYLVKTSINSELLNRSIHYAIGKKDSEQRLRYHVCELKKANQQILEQQKAVIEEERLKVILQMAGATAHEMNQPLMTMLGSIELLSMEKGVSEATKKNITRIRESGKRISNIVKQIQTLRHYETRSYAGGEKIINLDKRLNLIVFEDNDNDNDFEILMSVLTELDGINVKRMKDISEIPRISATTDLIILDCLLPSGTGLDFLNGLKKQGVDVPVIMVTGVGDEIIASKTIQAGAYDFLPKSRLNSNSLNRAIRNTLEKHRLKKDAAAAVSKMAEMSTTDELTGLFNRRYFKDVLKNEISRAQRSESEFTLFLADLDHFKIINDSYGHLAGDIVLKETALILKTCLRQGDIPCRYGGEELVVILPNTSAKQGKVMCERFRKTLCENSVDFEGIAVRVTASIGVAAFTKQSKDTFDSLIQKTDQALYKAKSRGRNQVCIAV